MIRAAISMLGVLLMATAAYASHPLITDDAGTSGKAKGQVEVSASFWQDKDDTNEPVNRKTDGGAAAVALTFGLHDRVDMIITAPYQWYTVYENGNRTFRADGISDITAELKWRFYENDGWSIAIKPGIVLPSGNAENGLGNGCTSYRLFLIVSKEIAPWAFHLNVGYILNENNAGIERDIWHASLAAEWEVVKDLKLVANIGAEKNPESIGSDNPTFLLGGIVYNISERISIDGGIKVGLTSQETDVNYLLGMTIKF